MRAGRAGLLILATLVALPVPAAGQYFGRNKVQYRSFDFQVIKTEHFDVYYYPVERAAALDAARMIERSYGRLSRVLQHEFRDRKPLIVYASHSDFQQTNALPSFIDESTGGVTEALKSRMILPFTGSYADFDHVLTHELVHGFQYDVIFGRGVLTDASPFGARLPLWFMEGMAEYLSIGTVDPHTQSWLRDAALTGYLRSIEEMSYRDDYLSYRFGQSLWSYIGSKWGDEVVGILLQKAPRTGLERAFATTLGITLEELSVEWSAAVRKQYLPQVAEFDQPQTFAKRLTSHNRLYDPWYVAPAISPDGAQLVFLSERDGFSFDLFLADAETGRIRKKLIASSRSGDFESLRYMNSSAGFSPDGRFVAFAAKTGGRDALYIYDLRRGKVWKKLPFDLNGVSSPSWAPDGTRIVFTGLDGGISDLFVTDLEGRLERLTNDAYADLLPAWSPDGRSIAFTTDRGPDTDLVELSYGNYRVALYQFEDSRIEELPWQAEGKNVNPVWSPEGDQLIWVNDRSGTNDLVLYDLTTKELSRITSVLSGIIGIGPLSPVLSWAKTGRLVFVYFEQAGYNIYTVDDPRTLPRRPLEGIVAAAPADGVRPTDAGAPHEDRPRAPVVARRSSAFDASFYRNGDSFRASDAREAPAARERSPVSIVAMLDSAALALPDTLAFEHADYSVKFTPDMIGRPTIGAQVGGYYGNGVYGGSFIALSDMLGNHNLLVAANLNGSLSDASVYAGYSYLKPRANVGFAIQQVPLYRYYGATFTELNVDGQPRDAVADVFVRDVIRSGQASLSYPFSTFRRFEMGLSAVHYKSDVLYRGYDRITGEPLEEDLRIGSLGYVQPMAALVFDNSMFGWTGPVYGRRYRLQLSRTLGDLTFTEALVDVRNYWNVKQRAVIAARLVGLSRFGGDADRFSLYWGGPYFLRGYDGGSFDLDSDECLDSRFWGNEPSLSRCPVRDQLIGSSAALMNLELRVPVITELQIGFLGSFPPVDAVAFFDGGLAWDESVCIVADLTTTTQCAEGRNVRVVWDRKPGQDPYLFREPLFSWGLGLRINVFYTILRMDYSFPLSRPDGGGIFSVSFGPSF
ncbi:MAG: BamA/TamA family outer membrane protein [Gemmatimonadetes bacterium]|nr:BamA/TamA family outer membrane protein [Gemmatimonadota bacterium]